MGQLVTKLSKSGAVICYSLISTDIVECARQYHKTLPVVTAALGRLLSAASIMGAMNKSEDGSTTLRIVADGPVGTVLAVGDCNGNVRGYVSNPMVELPLNAKGKLDVGGAVGRNGTLYCVRSARFGEPYIGTSSLVSGEIAEDIASYYAVSEQIPTACAFGVLVDVDLSVRAAGGFIAQLLPGATDEDIELLERNTASLSGVTDIIAGGADASDLADIVLKDFSAELINTAEVEYSCTCSREYVTGVLASLPREELETLIREDHGTEVLCHFCDKKYEFTESDLNNIITEHNL